MPVDQQKYSIIFNKMVNGYELIEDEDGCFLSLRLGSVDLDDILTDFNHAGFIISRSQLRQEITDFGVNFSSRKVHINNSWRVDEFFSGEIIQISGWNQRQIELVKIDSRGRFWVASDNAEINNLSGWYISFPPDTRLGEECELSFDGCIVRVDRANVLTPTFPMQYMNQILTPLLHQYTCNDNLEANVIIPLYEWCRDEVRPKKWVSINKWRSECLKAEEAGIDAFTFWYLTEHVVRNLDMMYQ